MFYQFLGGVIVGVISSWVYDHVKSQPSTQAPQPSTQVPQRMPVDVLQQQAQDLVPVIIPSNNVGITKVHAGQRVALELPLGSTPTGAQTSDQKVLAPIPGLPNMFQATMPGTATITTKFKPLAPPMPADILTSGLPLPMPLELMQTAIVQVTP
jgi:hypothetical protein